MNNLTRTCFALFAAAVLVTPAPAADPPTTVSVAVPDYVVTKLGNRDRVRIPGGELLRTEEGRPEVPFFVEDVDYPVGIQVQDVVMVERANPKTDSALLLPAVNLDTIDFDRSTLKPGAWPAEEFGWKVWPQDDGSTRLVITIYPFSYDPTTTKSTCYRDYRFDVRYVTTTVVLTGVATDEPVYDLGDNVRVLVRLANSGRPQDVEVATTVATMYTEEPVAELRGAEVAGLGEVDSVALEWPTRGKPAGDYVAEVQVRDRNGNELARQRVPFRLGDPEGAVTDFQVTPRHFKVGDRIELSLKFTNTGPVTLAPRCRFRVMNDGRVVDEINRVLPSLKPGASKTFRETWDTKDARKGAVYHAVGYVKYEGTATPSQSVMFSTNLMPVAEFSFLPDTAAVGEEIRFDGTASTDRDGEILEHLWEFGDGGEARDSAVVHVYYQPGDYNVRLTVTDIEGGTGTVTKVVVVGEGE